MIRKCLISRSLCVLLCLFGFTWQSVASEKYVIAAAELSGLFQTEEKPEGQGVYHRLLSRILVESGLYDSYQIVVMPMKRAKADFLRKAYACYSPGLETFEDDEKAALPKNLLSSKPFNRAMVRVVSASVDRLVAGPADVTAKDAISVVHGVPVNDEMKRMIENSGKTFTVHSELENLKLLVSGRVDLIFAFYPDIVFAYKELGMDSHFPYDEHYAPLVIHDNIICHAEHKQAFDKIQLRLERYKQQGLLKLLLQDYYIVDEPDGTEN